MIVKNALPVESAPWLNFISKELKPPFPFHQKVLGMDAFVEGRVYTDFIETEMGDN